MAGINKIQLKKIIMNIKSGGSTNLVKQKKLFIIFFF